MEITRRLMNDTVLANLDRIIDGKGTLIKKAIGADSLEYEIKEDRIRFPWFSMAEENKAYIIFISKLAEQARTAKRVTLKDKPVDKEKYAFRFSSSGLDLSVRSTRKQERFC